MRLSQKRPKRKQRPPNYKGSGSNSIDPPQSPNSRRIGPSPRISRIPTTDDE
jgi:hypothetical protein